jgi:hypothetical protein
MPVSYARSPREPLPIAVEQRLISEYIARHGVRRYPPGAASEDISGWMARARVRRAQNARSELAASKRRMAAMKGTL